MTTTRGSFRLSSVAALAFTLLAGAGCDRVIEKIHDHVDKMHGSSPAGGNGNAPGSAADAGAGPAGAPGTPGSPTPPGTPPPVDPGSQPGPVVCRADADCRLVADYCTGCDCRALGTGEADPVCAGTPVQCFADPCGRLAAACVAGRCVAQQPVPSCQDTVIAGDETTCKTSGEWKQFAYDACKARNLILNYYGPGGGDCGPDKTHQVKYVCCETPPTVPPPPPPPGPTPTPPPSLPPGVCTGAGEGGSSSCKPAATWKQYATENCARQGLTLTEINVSEPCGGDSFRYMKYTCCGK